MPHFSATQLPDYRKLFRARMRSRQGVRRAGDHAPYWMLLSSWLTAFYKGSKTLLRKGEREFLNDVFWAQYCLFFFIRTQDDIFDRHIESSSLIFIADQYLWEAESVFSRHFPRSTMFWEMYRKCMQETTQAILNVDALQQSPSSEPRDMLHWYGRVDSIFNICMFAVCLRYHGKEHVRLIQKFVRDVAIGSQILDDFADVKEDLDRGRFNYAARVSLQDMKKHTKITGSLILRATNNLYFTSRGNELLDESNEYFENAENTLNSLGLRETTLFSQGYKRKLEGMRKQVHRQRVKLLFGK